MKGSVECLNRDDNKAFDILNKHLNLLTDMRYVYTQANTFQKREFVSMVFDNNLYYQEGIYRTPIMMDIFTHNSWEMKEKGITLRLSLSAEREGFEPPDL